MPSIPSAWNYEEDDSQDKESSNENKTTKKENKTSFPFNFWVSYNLKDCAFVGCGKQERQRQDKTRQQINVYSSQPTHIIRFMPRLKISHFSNFFSS